MPCSTKSCALYISLTDVLLLFIVFTLIIINKSLCIFNHFFQFLSILIIFVIYFLEFILVSSIISMHQRSSIRDTKKEAKKKTHNEVSLKTWQRAIFTGAGPASFAAEVLNFCVRDEYRCVHFAFITRSLLRSLSLKTE